MFKGFKDFVLRGNVIDLAVAVVIGAAFNEIVQRITGSLIEPVIAATGGGNVSGLSTTLVEGNERAVIQWDAIITAAVNFLIVAAVVYFLFVLPMNKFRERRAAGQEAEPEAPSEEVLLLQEIRDLLGQASRGTPGG